MAHFPMFINIREKKCLVIGGGRVAARKVEALLRYEADVRVISTGVCDEILNMLPDPAVSVRKIDLSALPEEELAEEITGCLLVVAASDNRTVNHQTALVCHRLKVPVNVVDAPSECTFLFPAIVKKGQISVGINTGGQSPIVSRRIRENVEQAIPDYYADIADQLGEVRIFLKEKIAEEKVRRTILKEVSVKAFCRQRILNDEEIRDIIKDKLQTG